MEALLVPLSPRRKRKLTEIARNGRAALGRYTACTTVQMPTLLRCVHVEKLLNCSP